MVGKRRGVYIYKKVFINNHGCLLKWGKKNATNSRMKSIGHCIIGIRNAVVGGASPSREPRGSEGDGFMNVVF